MLNKAQKIWLWVSGLMFLIPEILFLTIPLTILSFFYDFSNTGIKAPINYIISQQFFTDYPIFIFIIMIIEWIGVLGLLIFSAKNKKTLFAVLLSIILIWITISLYMGFAISNMTIS